MPEGRVLPEISYVVAIFKLQDFVKEKVFHCQKSLTLFLL